MTPIKDQLNQAAEEIAKEVIKAMDYETFVTEDSGYKHKLTQLEKYSRVILTHLTPLAKQIESLKQELDGQKRLVMVR